MSISPLPILEQIWQQTLKWQPDPQQQQQFQQLYEGILAGNRQLNLTRIIDPAEFWEKHLWDSLKGVKGLFDQDQNGAIFSQHSVISNLKIIDVGTGAGFPGIPVAIAFSNVSLTLLDSTSKKIVFLHTLLPQLQLSSVMPITARAEEIGHHPAHRETYNIALIRAVGSVNTCAEYVLPLLKLEGVAVLYRGQWDEKDQDTLPAAIEKLGGEIIAIEKYTTPLSQSQRHCIYLRKCALTPSSFPRRVGIPQRKPL